MAKREMINGALYINGYLCNDAGQPITINNGYSSEEEREAHQHYKSAKAEKHYAKMGILDYDASKKPKKKRARFGYVPPLEDERWK